MPPTVGCQAAQRAEAVISMMPWADKADTVAVVTSPGQVTRIAATFDILGLYVWHCHIVEHKDNEMLVPFCVGDKTSDPGCGVVPH